VADALHVPVARVKLVLVHWLLHRGSICTARNGNRALFAGVHRLSLPVSFGRQWLFVCLLQS
jgi:hypothetical protein